MILKWECHLLLLMLLKVFKNAISYGDWLFY